MRKNDIKTTINRTNYTLLDGLKVFFYAIILPVIVSIVLTIVLSVASIFLDVTYDQLLASRFVAYLNIIAMGLAYLFLYFMYNKREKIKNFASCGLRNKPDFVCIVLSIVAGVACVFMFEPITSLILGGLEKVGFSIQSDLPYAMDSWARIVLGIIGYAVLPAIAEELVFRGVIQKGFNARCTAFCTIFFSTFCFVIMHGSLQQFIYQIVLGVVLASFYYFTKNILYSIIFHFINNLTVVLLSVVGMPKYMESGFFYISDFMGYFMPILLCVLGAGLIVLLIWYLSIKYKRHNDMIVEGDNIIIEEQNKKLGLKIFVSKIDQNEKYYFILGVTAAVVFWIFNTFGYF